MEFYDIAKFIDIGFAGITVDRQIDSNQVKVQQ